MSQYTIYTIVPVKYYPSFVAHTFLPKFNVMKEELLFTALACNRISDALDFDSQTDLIAYAGSNLVGIVKNGTLKTLSGHAGKVTCVKFARAGTLLYLISGSVDKVVNLWELDEFGNVLKDPVSFRDNHEFGLVSIGVFASKVTELMFATADTGSNIKIWKSVGGHVSCIQTLLISPQQALSLSLCYLPARLESIPMLLVGGTDCSLNVYVQSSRGEFEKRLSLVGHSDWIRSISVAKFNDSSSNTNADYNLDDLMIATASQDSYIRIWRVSVGKNSNSDNIDGSKQLSTKAFELTVNGVSYQFLLDAVLMGHDDWVQSVSWQAQNIETNKQQMALISASADKSLIVWRPDSHSQSWVPEERVGEVGGRTLGFYGAKLNANGTKIYSNGYNGAIHVWEKKLLDSSVSWEPAVGVSGHSMSVQGLKWDPTGSFFISVSSDQTARIFSTWKHQEIETWHEIGRSQIHGYNLNTIDFISKYQYVSGADEKVLRVFDAPKTFAQSLQGLGGDKEDESVLEQRPVGANLPALGLSNKAFFAGEATQVVSDLKLEIYPAEEITPTSCLPLTQPPFEEHLLQNTLWPETEKLYGHVYEIIKVATNKQGTMIASAAKASKAEHAAIRLWSTKKWIELCKPLMCHSLTVTALKFSNCGRFLLSAGRDRSWALFDVSDAENGNTKLIMHQAAAQSRIIWDCSFTPDDVYFATASRDKTVF